MKYKVVEKFVSINGEGTCAGQLAVFIRFQGCNLNCSFCDTKWANEQDAPFTWMTEQEIYEYIKETGVVNVTLTGGEPLKREGISALLELLGADESLRIEIETNGSIDLKPFADYRVSFTMDYKLACSGMEQSMCTDNFALLTGKDTVKFVVGSKQDLIRMKEVTEQYGLTQKTNVYISPVFGSIELVEMVNFLMENKMNKVTMQIQLHKIIWDPEKRGV